MKARRPWPIATFLGLSWVSGCWTTCLETCPDPAPSFTRTITPADVEALQVEPEFARNRVCTHLCSGDPTSPMPPDSGQLDAGQFYQPRQYAQCAVEGLTLTCSFLPLCSD